MQLAVVTSQVLSREQKHKLQQLHEKHREPWLLPPRSPLLPLGYGKELASINECIRFCDLLVAFPVLDCPVKLHNIPRLQPSNTPWEAMANAMRLDVPVRCWSHAKLEPVPWLKDCGGGWAEGVAVGLKLQKEIF